MAETESPLRKEGTAAPDYPGLLRFLVGPFLESPESLLVDWEAVKDGERVWIRLAFAGEDRGRVFGRGGRNLQAIRTVLSAAAAAAGQSLHLSIYEEEGASDQAKPRSSNRSIFAKKPEGKKFRPRPISTDRLQ